MYQFTQRTLTERSRPFRYFYYLVSSVRLTSFAAWKSSGEPNPFVAKTYRHKVTEQAEFVDIFDDYKSHGG